MGIFFNRALLEVKRTVNGNEEDLSENDDNIDYSAAEDDTNEDQEENNNPDTDEQPNATKDTEEDSNDEEQDTNDNNETQESDDEESNDYTIPDDSDNGDLETDDNIENDDNEEESDILDNGTDLQNLENDLFKDLTQEQINIKNIELKKQYLEVYNACINIMNRINRIPKTSSNIKILEFISKKLLQLKDIVYFYMANTFETKTYIENSINYQKYIATLNTIDKLFKEIKNKEQE